MPATMGALKGAEERPTVTGQSTELERAIRTVVECHNKYCYKRFWNKKAQGINQSKFRDMIGDELNHMLTGTKEEKLANEEFKKLDENGDNKISFDEYWKLISEVARIFSNVKKYEAEKKDGP